MKNMQRKITESAGRLGVIEPISVRIPDAIRITGMSRSRI